MPDDLPIPGYELLSLLGSGSCGAVYRARDLADPAVERAVKVFDPMAISRRVLDARLQQLQALHSPRPCPGVVQTHAWRMNNPPYYVVMDLMASIDRNGECRPCSTLEYWIGRIHAPEAWSLIAEIASTLAQLHLSGLSHGNLRPRNVFLTTDPAARAKITDAGQGWVEGLHHIELTDHLFHMAPEQIARPERNQQAEAARWDVYAFGVLAYRLLTNQWPRGQKAIAAQVAHMAATGGKRLPWREKEILAEIESQPEVTFAKSAEDHNEELRRGLLTRCLHLSARERPLDMREVWEEMQRRELVSSREKDKVTAASHQQAMARSLGASRKRNKLLVYSLLALGSYAALTQLHLCSSIRAHKRQDLEITAVKNEQKKAVEELQGMRKATRQAGDALAQEKDAAAAGINALFNALVDSNGTESLGALPEPVLRQTLAFYQRRAEALSVKEEGLAEKARVLLNLARLQDQLMLPAEAVASYRESMATLRKNQAVERSPAEIRANLELLADTLNRTAQLEITRGQAGEARALLEESARLYQQLMQSTTTPGEKLREKAAALFLSQARYFHREKGRPDEAAGHLDTVISFLRGDTGTPESPRLRRLLAEAEHERGMVLRHLGKSRVAALEALGASLDVLVSLRAKADNAAEADRALLAAVYVETGELRGEENNPPKAMEAQINAINLLQSYLQKQPGADEARSHLARAYREVARLERDEQKTESALKRARAAAELSREVLKRQSQSREFILALGACLATLAEVLASDAQVEAAEETVAEAVALVQKAPAFSSGDITRFQTAAQQAALAQIFTAQGTILKIAAQENEARSAFASAVVSWQKVLELVPGHTLAAEQLALVQQALSQPPVVPKAVPVDAPPEEKAPPASPASPGRRRPR